ncbi:MAG: PAS domain-containing protein [Myxococcales bacterium]|nr:PAS domain-containing protein [Myxococcales bacterium]
MERLLDQIRAIGAVSIDPWVVVDAEQRIVDFNPHYRAFFSRQQARKLRGSVCCQQMKLGVCDEGCLARRCIEEEAPARFDEIPARVDGEENDRPVIVSVTPLRDEDGAAVALIMLRDVSDAASMQRKYKEMLDRETKEKERLRDEIGRKTKELMDTNMELNRIQKELMRFKKGLFG